MRTVMAVALLCCAAVCCARPVLPVSCHPTLTNQPHPHDVLTLSCVLIPCLYVAVSRQCDAVPDHIDSSAQHPSTHPNHQTITQSGSMKFTVMIPFCCVVFVLLLAVLAGCSSLSRSTARTAGLPI